jgi:hypothetical protein
MKDPLDLTGRPLAFDPTAKSASSDLPAFAARPEGAPVYHGFPVLEDVEAEGFLSGKITDFEAEKCDDGDAFIVAPDGTRAGLVWEVADEPHFSRVCVEDADRWGVWAVSFPHPMSSRENAKKTLKQYSLS